MTDHKLKIGRERLINLVLGRKKCEVRFNDRDYQAEDRLIFHDDIAEYSFVITHVHSGLGLAEGYVVLSVVKDAVVNNNVKNTVRMNE